MTTPETVAWALLGAVGAAGAAAAGWGLAEAGAPVVRHLHFHAGPAGNLDLTREPRRIGGRAGAAVPGRPSMRAAWLRIVHLSDLHLHRRPGRAHRLALQWVASLRPDLVVVTGDLVDGASRPGVAARYLDALARITRLAFVWGNHDHERAREMDALRELARPGGVWVLENRRLVLFSPGLTVELVGLDTPDQQRDRCSEALESLPLEEVWWPAGTPPVNPVAGGAGPRVRIVAAHTYHVIEHSPEYLDGALVLAGDTHGGQVVLPLLGPVWARWVHHHRFVQGLYRVGGTWLYINVGLGTIGPPVRFACPPEVTVLDVEGPAMDDAGEGLQPGG